MTLVDAIARQEGFHVPHSRAQRNHNPGNLDYGMFARLHGSTKPDQQGYAEFPDDKTGFAALKALLLSTAYRGLTIERAIIRYCPPTGDPRGDNNTAQYIKNLCEWTGLQPDMLIDQAV